MLDPGLAAADATPAGWSAIKSIVVGIDGTEASLVALDWAAERAVRGSTRVELVMIAGTIFSDDFRIDASTLKAEHRLRDLAPGVEIASLHVPGRMPGSLLELASAADLLVIGCHHGRPLRSALAGRLPLRIASASSVPVVVVPDDWSPATKPVLVGLGDDSSSAAALEVAASEADAAGVPLTVVHAWRMPAPQMEGAIALLASPLHVKAGHAKILREAALGLAHTHPGLHVDQVLVQEEAAAALSARAKDASLLVIGTHHLGLFAGARSGSVGHELLSRPSVPVCVVPGERH
jgi:nucleotide-binding universal stress UspA family protein